MVSKAAASRSDWCQTDVTHVLVRSVVAWADISYVLGAVESRLKPVVPSQCRFRNLNILTCVDPESELGRGGSSRCPPGRSGDMKTVVLVATLVLVVPGAATANSNCPHPNNIVVNCGFDVNDFSNWFFADGTPYYDGSGGANAPGSMCVDAADDGGTWIVFLGYCVTGFSSGETYDGGFAYRQESGGALVDTYLELSQRPQTNCGGVPLAIDLIPDVSPTQEWADSPTLGVTPVSTTGGLGLIAYFESSAPFAVCFDDVYLGIDLPPVDLVFRDGFEDGTTDAWSALSP